MQQTPTTEPSKADKANEKKKAPVVIFSDIIAKFRRQSLSEHQKGADFERLMQRWLRTAKVYSELFSHVWLWEEFPARADFGGKDIGIDIVAKTHEGEYWAIQCKCYKENAVMNKAAIDSFIAASSKQFTSESGGGTVGFSRRLWISTANHRWTDEAEAEIKGQNPPFSRIGLSYLETSGVDWLKILQGMEGQEARRPCKRLLPHQQATLEKAKEHYITEVSERGKLVMACGTGKTFTSLKIAEEVTGGRALVLYMVPSIALLSQALNDWFADSEREIKAVCVCSDPTSSRLTRRASGRDDSDEAASVVDLALPATTDIKQIARRIEGFQAHEGLTVVFSTYQSVAVVMEAQRLLLQQTDGKWGVFDLVICDEAHRTTGAKLKGEDESEFTKIHYNENVRAKRRLYMTATPRIYGDSAKSRAKEKDCILCSMDDESIYGKEFYRVPFSYAVRNGILTDYRVVVLAQSEGDIPAGVEKLIRDPELKGLDYETAVKLIGVINGLSKRFSDDNDRRIIETDPGMMKRALAFTRIIGNKDVPGSSKSIAALLPRVCEKYRETLSDEERKTVVRIDARHVDGSMGATKRNEQLSWLAADTGEAKVQEASGGKEAGEVSGTEESTPQEASEVTGEGADQEAREEAAATGEAQGASGATAEMLESDAKDADKGESDAAHSGKDKAPGEAIKDAGSSCRVLCNVRCLSEGVDVPALDAVLFLSPKNSQVEVVQAVGRVMRSFKKGTPEEKKYGYIIIPVVVPKGKTAEEALNDNKSFAAVWQILNALRAHDDHFNAIINSIALNESEGNGDGGNTGRGGGRGNGDDGNSGINGTIFFENIPHYKAKLVDKCGERAYWENWAVDVGVKARAFMERIERLVHEAGSECSLEFARFVNSLRTILNPAISEGECIEMLSQHIITQPVFEALFEGYQFLRENPVSVSMERMLSVLSRSQAFLKDMEQFAVFFDSVRANVKGIVTLGAKQTVIKDLYERFFKIAFPHTVEKLGIVYTPVECVNFILHSVDDVLRADFGLTLSSEGVHILDPFVGTGTFITRLLQSGLIDEGNIQRKWQSEIHANEINLLAYYVASINIEATYYAQEGRGEYKPFAGLCLTDTFQMGEEKDKPGELGLDYFTEEAVAISEQKKVNIRVIIGNPPYSVGQRSANDNAQNQHYPRLEGRIAATYAAHSSATNKNSLYDSYIKAFRWASDRLDQEQGGIIGFISNGSWLDGNAQEGLRVCLEAEFDKVYVFNLRGNARTSGEMRRRERDSVFGQGTRTTIAITLLVKLPQGARGEGDNAQGSAPQRCAQIFYHDIGDYLRRDQKLYLIKEYASVTGVPWDVITPNEKHDWINPRGGEFESLIPLGDKDNKENNQTFFEPVYSRGLATARDAWCYNFSLESLTNNMKLTIDFYNENREAYARAKETNSNALLENYIDYDSRKGSWNRGLKNLCERNEAIDFNESSLRSFIYRPFTRVHGYFDKSMNDMTYQLPSLFPTPDKRNLVICVPGIGGTKDFSCIITDTLPDLSIVGASQCFPLYWYKDVPLEDPSLFDANKHHWVRRDGITDWVMSQIRQRFRGAERLAKETVFYYVYGLLHSPDYRRTFAADLKKSLPRIPIVEEAASFNAFVAAGRKLAELHLGYDKELEAAEQKASSLGVHVVCDGEPPAQDDEAAWDYWRVSKMRFGKLAGAQGTGSKTADKSRIVYNSRTTIEGVPPQAYEYVVNGKSAIEWVMERYAVTTDKRSGIVNDVNDLSREKGMPRYVLDVLLSVICLSVETQQIVGSLPPLKVAH